MAQEGRARLPESELGMNRNVQFGYFGHGDVFIAQWNGDLDHDPTTGDGISACFNMKDGSDVVLMAAFEGYLHRAGVEKNQISATLLASAETILTEVNDLPSCSMKVRDLDSIADGEPEPYYDIPSLRLQALSATIPSHPGRVEQVGGTGTYTYDSESGLRFVMAGLSVGHGEKEPIIQSRAEFCEADIPVMARLVCGMALGEYRREIATFMNRRFFGPNLK